MRKLQEYAVDELTIKDKQDIWLQTVSENIFVICKTPMAKTITKRTLAGYNEVKINAHYFDNLINIMKNKPQQFTSKILKPSYWKYRGKNMKFNAIVGNPPYQQMDGGNRNSSSPVYQFFVSQAKNISPDYVSMITPSRWFAGGKGLDDFRKEMLNDKHLEMIFDYVDSNDCFKGVDIAGGVNYYLWNSKYNGLCNFTSIRGRQVDTMQRDLGEYDILIRNNASVKLLRRIIASPDKSMEDVVGTRNTFGINTDEHGVNKQDSVNSLVLACSQKGNNIAFAYVSPNKITKGHDYINKYKVAIGRSVPRNGEVGVDPSVGYRAITTVHIFMPNTVFTDTYLLLSSFSTLEEAENFAKYMTLKLPRFLLHETYTSMAISKNNFRFVPYLDYSKSWTDQELYSRYSCSEEEIKLVDSMMRPLEYVKH